MGGARKKEKDRRRMRERENIERHRERVRQEEGRRDGEQEFPLKHFFGRSCRVVIMPM